MKKLLIMTCAVATYAALATPPSISDIQFNQDYNRLVTISYTLGGADAIVTMDVLTNGVSIGRAFYSNATGDVNVKVNDTQLETDLVVTLAGSAVADSCCTFLACYLNQLLCDKGTSH